MIRRNNNKIKELISIMILFSIIFMVSIPFNVVNASYNGSDTQIYDFSYILESHLKYKKIKFIKIRVCNSMVYIIDSDYHLYAVESLFLPPNAYNIKEIKTKIINMLEHDQQLTIQESNDDFNKNLEYIYDIFIINISDKKVLSVVVWPWTSQDFINQLKPIVAEVAHEYGLQSAIIILDIFSNSTDKKILNKFMNYDINDPFENAILSYMKKHPELHSLVPMAGFSPYGYISIDLYVDYGKDAPVIPVETFEDMARHVLTSLGACDSGIPLIIQYYEGLYVKTDIGVNHDSSGYDRISKLANADKAEAVEKVPDGVEGGENIISRDSIVPFVLSLVSVLLISIFSYKK